MSFIITGTGRAVPERTVTNDELSTMMETSDEWISTRTGIRERRVLTHETLLGLTAAAGRAALENAGVSPDEIDLLLVTTLQGDCVSPSLCCLAAGELGLSRCTQMLDLVHLAGESVVPADAAPELRLAANRMTLTDHDAGAAAELLYGMVRRAETSA